MPRRCHRRVEPHRASPLSCCRKAQPRAQQSACATRRAWKKRPIWRSVFASPETDHRNIGPSQCSPDHGLVSAILMQFYSFGLGKRDPCQTHGMSPKTWCLAPVVNHGTQKLRGVAGPWAFRCPGTNRSHGLVSAPRLNVKNGVTELGYVVGSVF